MSDLHYWLLNLNETCNLTNVTDATWPCDDVMIVSYESNRWYRS